MKKITEFLTTKLTAKQNNTIATVLMVAGILVNLFDMMQNGFVLKPLPVIIAVVLVAVGYAYQLLFVRCPHCGDKLKTEKNKSKLPDKCPNCGKRLDTLPKN